MVNRFSPGNSLPILYRGPDSYWPITREVLSSLRLAMPTPCKCTDCEGLRREKFPDESRYTIVEKGGNQSAATNLRHPDALFGDGRSYRKADWRDMAPASPRHARKPASADPDRSVTRVENRLAELDALKKGLGL
jgi:hypothetical protein